MTDQERFIRMIANMEGMTISPQLTMMARDLFGPLQPRPDGSRRERLQVAMNTAFDMMKGQLCILLLQDLGGSRTYSVEQIDHETRDFVMTIESVHDGKAMRFEIKRKDEF